MNFARKEPRLAMKKSYNNRNKTRGFISEPLEAKVASFKITKIEMELSSLNRQRTYDESMGCFYYKGLGNVLGLILFEDNNDNNNYY